MKVFWLNLGPPRHRYSWNTKSRRARPRRCRRCGHSSHSRELGGIDRRSVGDRGHGLGTAAMISPGRADRMLGSVPRSGTTRAIAWLTLGATCCLACGRPAQAQAMATHDPRIPPTTGPAPETLASPVAMPFRPDAWLDTVDVANEATTPL